MTEVEKITKIPVEKLEVDPANIRSKPDLTPEFVKDVREHEVIHPLVVRPRSGGRYGVIAGSRRLTAARNAGLKEVECKVVKVDDDLEARAISARENRHHKDISEGTWLNVVEEFYNATDGRLSRPKRIKEVAERLNFSRAAVSQYVTILENLPSHLIARGKEPDERSESEKKALKEIESKMPVPEREGKEVSTGKKSKEKPPIKLKVIPIRSLYLLAESEEFQEVAEKDPIRAHELGTKAIEVGQDQVKRKVLSSLKKPKEKKETLKFSPSLGEPVKINLILNARVADALERYAKTKNWTSHRAVQVIVREFLKKEGFYEEPPVPSELEGVL